MYINTTGLTLRETRYKDSSKILTVLTADKGKITVTVRGALRKNSPLAAPTQLLAFSEMTLFQSRDRWTLTEARSIEQFHGLRDGIVPLSLGSYFAEVTEAVADEDSPNAEILPLCLNALYALSGGEKPPELLKTAFELRLMAISGFAPLLSQCANCETEPADGAMLDLSGGTICCLSCMPQDRQGFVRFSHGSLSAARYILGCDAKRLFSFTLRDIKNLASATEAYLLTQLDRRFRTLDYYKGIAK